MIEPIPSARFDIQSAWRKTKEALTKMTPAQKRQTLIDAKILTPTGRVAKPYRGVIVSQRKPLAAAV